MITNLHNNPWLDIQSAEFGRLSRRRVDTEANFALFWIKDHDDHVGLLIEIDRDISLTSLQKAKINIRDISIDVIEEHEENIRALTVKLENIRNQDVFLKLCQDLIDQVKNSQQNQSTFHQICKRLLKWQSLLSGKSQNLLSKNEIQGLYAELYFLAEALTHDSSRESTIVEGWKGPEKTQHDFILNDIAIEIKSIAGDQRHKVRISSEDQLDTHLSKLYLRIYLLSEAPNGGESLNSIVKRITNLLSSRENKNLFEVKLEKARYIDISDYDVPTFLVKECRTYQVIDGFPRITRTTIPQGIVSVTYDLILASIDKFRINNIAVMEN